MNSRLSAAALSAAAIATLAACSSSSKTAAPANTTTAATAAAGSSASAAAPGSASSAAPTAPAATKSINICTAIPPTTVVKLTGKPYTVASPEGAAVAGADARCAYDDVDNTDSGVTLSVFLQNVDSTWQAVHTGNITDVSGVGDKAFWDNDNTLYAVSGSTLIQVNGLDAEAPTVALAKALLAAMH